jgi:murein DD-endopeptidase MepM/ murein hydrolase activator NlpD
MSTSPHSKHRLGAVADRVPFSRVKAVVFGVGLAAVVAGCPAATDDSGKQDTTVASAGTAAPGSAAPAAALDSVAGVPAVPRDSLSTVSGDTGTVQLYPTNPRRGGVLFAFADGVASSIPRCAWKGAPLPCYSHGSGVLAVVPLTADEPAGTFTLSIERAGGRISRQITVADRDLGRNVIMLDSARYALLRNTSDIARDARVMRGVLSSETPERLWTRAWKEPVPLGRSAGYGEDRFYYRASDSSRAIRVDAGARVRGAFGGDTTATAASDAPGWRHSGIDIPVRRGTSVRAPANGIVADVGTYVLTGRTLVIDHGRGVHSAYFHLDTVLVQKGDRVRESGIMARVGDSGLATGPHLHYGIYIHGKDVDPAAWRDMPPFAIAATADSARRATPR